MYEDILQEKTSIFTSYISLGVCQRQVLLGEWVARGARSGANESYLSSARSVLDRLPLPSAGNLLTAGGGVFFMLMLGIALVGQLQLAALRP